MARYYRNSEAANILLINDTAMRWYAHMGWIIALKVDGVLLYPGDYFDEIAEALEDARRALWGNPIEHQFNMIAASRDDRPENYLKEWRNAVEGAIRQGPAGELYLPIAEAHEFLGTVRPTAVIDLNGQPVAPLTVDWAERARLAGSYGRNGGPKAMANVTNSQQSDPAEESTVGAVPADKSTITSDAQATQPNDGRIREAIAVTPDHSEDLAALQEAYPSIEPSAVRSWARENGLKVSMRGRIGTEILQRYEAARGI